MTFEPECRERESSIDAEGFASERASRCHVGCAHVGSGPVGVGSIRAWPRSGRVREGRHNLVATDRAHLGDRGLRGIALTRGSILFG